MHAPHASVSNVPTTILSVVTSVAAGFTRIKVKFNPEFYVGVTVSAAAAEASSKGGGICLIEKWGWTYIDLDLLRSVRDCLLTSRIGRAFTQTYYELNKIF
jgi:hypothetical protein